MNYFKYKTPAAHTNCRKEICLNLSIYPQNCKVNGCLPLLLVQYLVLNFRNDMNMTLTFDLSNKIFNKYVQCRNQIGIFGDKCGWKLKN